MEAINLILNYIVVPVIVWAYTTDKKITIFETKLNYCEKRETKYNDDFTRLFQKIDDLKDEMHNLFNKR